jgi:ribose 5-phosphate isomerase B
MKWFVGSDHAGYRLKKALADVVRGWGDEVVDVGTSDSEHSVDYPDYAVAAAKGVLREPGSLGLLVCGSGTGISIAANKIGGIRAVRATDPWSARLGREHNDCNVVCLGERVTGPGLAEDIIKAFRDAKFVGGRHQQRVDKLTQLDE